ncbi:hypothetical protein BC834DRAFT_626099 [Gloeopeniophorella convolvens]|nr:hypothetical protein BC834DRAFT_626099 [Gloeopeniophorella convolvens]
MITAMLLSLLAFSTFAFRGSAAVTSRCFPGDSCFPSASVISAFNASIGGKLFAERPAAAVCYPTDPAYNASSCSVVTTNYLVDQWRTDQFGDYEQINWETCGNADSCRLPLVSNSSTCGQGSIPDYAVQATTADDVVKYVKFATQYNLRIVVKNTGHDYAGRSAGKGGFAIWTHGIQGISRNASFVPSGCNASTIPPQDSVTMGTGTQWETVYEFANNNSIIIVGGNAGHVGAAGGWVQGGGHSVLSQSFGMGVDNLLEATIVTPDGVHQTINECTNPDLFWAVRGGGGGTWGVLTSITYKAHPSVLHRLHSLPDGAPHAPSTPGTPLKVPRAVTAYMWPPLCRCGSGSEL